MSRQTLRERNRDLLRRLYVGLESGDLEQITPLLAASIVVRLSGAEDLNGTYRGAAEVKRLYGLVLDRLGPGFTVPAHDVLVHDESLVVVARGSSFGDADRGMDVYHFEDGLISEIWLTAWRASDHDRD
jgi:ketosteroid isomerase-like protein